MVRGASGLAPDFAELERMAIKHVAAAGWVQAESAASQSSLAAQASVAMLTGYDRRTARRSTFCAWPTAPATRLFADSFSPIQNAPAPLFFFIGETRDIERIRTSP